MTILKMKKGKLPYMCQCYKSQIGRGKKGRGNHIYPFCRPHGKGDCAVPHHKPIRPGFRGGEGEKTFSLLSYGEGKGGNRGPLIIQSWVEREGKKGREEKGSQTQYNRNKNARPNLEATLLRSAKEKYIQHNPAARRH